MSRTPTHRRGLTVFDLLVVLAVLAVFFALLLPAIQKVREAANRVRCQNNLKQMGLAMHIHHDDWGRLPAGGTGEPNMNQQNSGSWCFRILPYIEQDNLYKAILTGQGGNAAVPLYYCPGRRKPALYNDLPKIDYAGNVGSADDPEKPAVEDGVFTKAGVKLADITDGTSNTIMLGEKGLRTKEYLTGKGAGDKNSCWTGGLIDALRSCDGGKRFPERDVATADHERGFGSAHEAAANFALCDGSVRHISYTIKGEIFKALCTRNGQEDVNLNDF